MSEFLTLTGGEGGRSATRSLAGGTAIFPFLYSQINVIIFSCFINSFSHSRLKSYLNYVDLDTVILGVKVTTMLLL